MVQFNPHLSSDFDPKSRGISLAGYGESGSGKTSFIATCPDPVVFDTDGGEATLREHHIPVIPLDQISTLKLVAFLKNPSPTIKVGGVEYPIKTIVLDTATLYVERVLIPEIKGGKKTMSYQEWGDVSVTLRSICTLGDALKHKGINFVFLCHMASQKDELTGTMYAGPSLPGKMFFDTGKYFDLFLYFRAHPSKKSIVRVLRTGNIPASDRLNIVPNNETPNMKEWITNLETGKTVSVTEVEE